MAAKKAMPKMPMEPDGDDAQRSSKSGGKFPAKKAVPSKKSK